MSIKKKFVTAVATAGLLAGLFGSALVPSALARGSEVPTASKTHIENTSNGNENGLRPVGPGAGSYSDPGNGLGYVGGDKHGTPMRSSNSWTQYMFENRADDDNDETTNDLSLGFTLYGSQVSGGGKDKWNSITSADLTATSSSAAIQVAWAYAYDGDSDTVDGGCEDALIANAFGTSDSVLNVSGIGEGGNNTGYDGDTNENLDSHDGDGHNQYYLCIKAKSYRTPGTATITVTANGVTLPKVTVRALGDLASLSVVPLSTTTVAQGNGYVPFFFQVQGKDAAGAIINDTSESLSNWGDGSIIDLHEWVDQSGNGDYDLYERGTDADTMVENKAGDPIEFLGGGTNDDWQNHTPATATSRQAWARDVYGLESDTCNGDTYAGAKDGDAGSSYALGVEMENGVGRVIQSTNAVTITCTGPASSAVLTGFSATTFTGKPATQLQMNEGGATKYWITAKVNDKYGKTLGIGGDDSDHTMGWLSAVSDGDDDSDLNLVDDFGSGHVARDGKIYVAYIKPDDDLSNNKKYGFKISSDISAISTVFQQLEQLVTFQSTLGDSYVITKVWSNGHKTLTATVDFGLDCSSDTVTFSYEKANGDTASLNRRANVDGVATLVITRRNLKTFIDAACGYDYYAPLVKAIFK